MALNRISFNRGSGGLGRPLAGFDHYSGMLFYSNTLPSGFDSNNRVKKIFSIDDAVALGITDTHIGETQATGTVEITAIGANSDTIEIKVLTPDGSVSLGTTTKTASESTVTLLAAACVVTINAGTETHGFTASNLAGVITITAPEGSGVFYNSGTPISTVIVGTITRTITQFSAGVASPIDTMHYHIDRFFKIQPKGVLYVGVYGIPGSYTFTEATTMRIFANGEIRQLGVYAPGATFNAALVTALDTEVMKGEDADAPYSAILTPNIKGTALSALPTLASNSDYRVSVDIAMDGGAVGLDLYYAQGVSIGTMGALLGAVSLASVNENIGWVQKFNISDGTEFETAWFGNGVAVKDQASSLLDTLNSYKYIFFRKFTNRTGTYYNDSHTSIANTSDFAYIENVRTMDKAIRLIQENTLPKLNGPLLVNANGTLTEQDISEFERLSAIGLDDMQRNQEISAYSFAMDSSQDVLTTSQVEATITIVPVGVARNIVFNVKFATSI